MSGYRFHGRRPPPIRAKASLSAFALDRRPMRLKLARLRQLKLDEWSWLLEAALTVCLSSFAIRVMPFRRLAKLLEWTSEGARNPPADYELLVGKACWAIQAVSRGAPWKTVCFQKGVALHWMMRRRNVKTVLNYGVARQPGRGLAAHVWISFKGSDILGGEVADQFARVASFPSTSPDGLAQLERL